MSACMLFSACMLYISLDNPNNLDPHSSDNPKYDNYNSQDPNYSVILVTLIILKIVASTGTAPAVSTGRLDFAEPGQKQNII